MTAVAPETTGKRHGLGRRKLLDGEMATAVVDVDGAKAALFKVSVVFKPSSTSSLLLLAPPILVAEIGGNGSAVTRTSVLGGATGRGFGSATELASTFLTL